MSLPSLVAPVYELIVPSTKAKIKYRPFLVKEEKALLIAQQSEDENVMLDTLKSVITTCTHNKVDVEKLAVFDIEYMFCQIRSKSVGEIAEIVYNCLNCNDAKGKFKFSLDLSKIEVEFNEKHVRKMLLFNDVGIAMKYPSLDVIKKIKDFETLDIDIIFNVVIDCIESIYTDDEVFLAKDQTREELESFINNLTKEQFDKIEEFFATMPKLQKELKWTCPNCSYKHKTMIQGIESFF